MKTKQILFCLFILTPSLLMAQETFKRRSNPVAVDVGAPVVERPKPMEMVVTQNTKPVVIWLSPDQASNTILVKKMVVKVGVNSKIKLRNVTLMVNGSEPLGTRGIGVTSTEANKFDQFIEKEIDLSEGPNEIKVLAENEANEVTIESRMVNVKSSSMIASLAPRTDYALILATNDYDEWNDLVNPVFDATAIKKDLEELYGYKVDMVINPTKSMFLSKLREYSQKNYLPDDQLFIFIAGHGKFDALIKDGYVVAKDSKISDENNETYVSFSDLRTRIDNNPCRHVFLTMDACFGGTFDQTIAKRGGDDMDEDLGFNVAVQSDLIKRKLQYKSRIYLTSGGKEYVSDGRPGRHSPFASRVLEALRSGGGRMRVLTSSTIYSYTEAGSQVPRYGTFGDNEPGSEFVFVRGQQ
jgi:hypothetical protein